MKTKVIVAFLLSIVTASQPAFTAVRRKLPNDEAPHVARGTVGAHAPQRLDRFHAQVIGPARQNVALGEPQQLRCGFLIAAHSDFVQRQRQNHRVERFDRIRQQLSALGCTGNGKLSHHCVVK